MEKKLTLEKATLRVCNLPVWPVPRDWVGKEKEEKRVQLALAQERKKEIEAAVFRGEFGTKYRNGEHPEARDIEPEKLDVFAKAQGWIEAAPQPAGEVTGSGASRSAAGAGKVEQTNTLRVLGLVALVLAEKVKKFKKDDGINAKVVADDVETMASDLGIKVRGLGASTVRAKMKEAVELVAQEVTAKKKAV